MSFALNGSHIEGGNFNNVAGNMTQVFNSTVRPTRPQADAGRPFGLDNLNRQNRCAHPTRLADSRNPISPIEYDGVDEVAARFIPLHLDGGESRAHPTDISTAYNSVRGNMTQLNVTSYGESGIDILYHSVVTEALHDSVERFPEPACHPGTRTRVLEELRAWSVDTSPESSIMWLYGAAGMGKSAIAQMFAGDCQEQDRLGASFFFRRGHPKRGMWNGLFTTLAYQLATSISELLLPIQQAVESDKLVVGRAMTVQFQKLLAKPFQNTSSLQLMPVIVLDGLDECMDHKVQQQIIHLFITAIRDHQLPVRLLITSRPEPHLRETLQSNNTFSICRHSELSADESAYNDIRIYLQEEFSRIYHEFLGRGIDLGPSWPASKAVKHLIRKSSGIFIYAATVVRFIGDEYTHPAERLAAVLNLDPNSTAPLDDLYTEILSVVPPESTRLRVLHAIWQGTQDNCVAMRPEHIETFFLLPSGSARLALRALHSLFYVPPMYTRFGVPDNVFPLHASLDDYLGDPQRSGRWCLSTAWLHSDFLHCALRLLSSPPTTADTRNFHLNVVGGLPRLLSFVTPCSTLINLLRHEQVQNTIFSRFGDSESWPKRGSGYPEDLVQLWEDHQFIAELVDRSVDRSPTPNKARPTYKFDAIYREIFRQNPDLLFLLRPTVIHHDLNGVIFCLGPQHNFRVFQPFLKIRGLFTLPLNPGDLPVAFLADRYRAGNLYLGRQAISEDLALLWIRIAKTRLMEGSLDFTSYSAILTDCHPSSRILHELESLDLGQICDPRNINPVDHYQAHTRIFSDPRSDDAVLEWLRRFPDPPLQAIAFWEKQRVAINQCAFKDGQR